MTLSPSIARFVLVDDSGNVINAANPLQVGATVIVGDIELGAVELKDATTSDRAKIADGTTVVKADSAVAVKDPVLGLDNDAAVTTDATATLSARLRGLVNMVKDVWDSTNHALRVTASQGAITDQSGTITTGGSSQVLMAANANRRYLLIQNVGVGDLWVRLSAAAAAATQPSILIQPKMAFVMEGSFVCTSEIRVFGATTAQPYTAKEA